MGWRASAANQRRVAKRASRYYTGVNLFSMVGVCFALFFVNMNATRPDQYLGPNLTNVKYAHVEPGASREDAVVLTIDRDGRVFFGARQIEDDAIPERIREWVRSGSEQKIYLRADARARNADVSAVVNEIQRSGVTNVAILTDMPVPHR